MRVRQPAKAAFLTHRGSSPSQLITAAVLAVVAASAPAQRQFDELRMRTLPMDEDGTTAIATGDVDGDGDLDAVIANGYPGAEQNRLYLNDGRGNFTDVTTTHMPPNADASQAVALGDVDGDGDLDIVFGNFGQNRLYLNDGRGNFTDVTTTHMPPDGVNTNAVVMVDVDGDGHPDLVFGNFGQNRLYLNNGHGRFTGVTASRMPVEINSATYAVAAGDVDGDGDLDLVIAEGGASRQSRLYVNDGTGFYSDVTAAQMPPSTGMARAVALGDVDGDGDLDMVIAGGTNATAEATRIHLNDGSGFFTNTNSPNTLRSFGVALGDVDGDTDLDLVFACYGQENSLYLNDGTGSYARATPANVPAAVDDTRAVAVADVDGDSDLDILFGNDDQQNKLYLNDGRGSYTDAMSLRMPFDRDICTDVALGDVDGDHDLDMVFALYNSGSRLRNGICTIYFNDGRGSYTDVTASQFPAASLNATSVTLGDVDGDGDLDLVAGTSAPRLYQNDGTGKFTNVTATHLPGAGYFPGNGDIALSDVDGDGDLDLVLGNYYYPGVQNQLFLNNGNGVFVDVTAARLPVDTDPTRAVALGDVDGDGDLDIVFGNVGQDRLYLNSGNGFYTDATATRMPVSALATADVALGDVDGDADLDIVFGGEQNRLYLNNGSGFYTDATAARMPVGGSTSVAVGDLDGDGDLDIVFGDGQDLLFVNNGNGFYTDATATRMAVGVDPTSATALGDVDGDDDLDIVFANVLQSRLYINLLRQIDSPFLLRVGETYPLDIYARYGPPSATDVAQVLLSTATARIPVPPFGTFGLEPTQLLVLPPFAIPRPAGVGTLTLVLPNVPSLAGLSLHSQAIIAPQPFPPRLTGVVSDVLLR